MAIQIATTTITLIVSIIVSATALAQENKTQTWYGVLDAGPVKLRLQMEITEESPGKFTGKMISLDQGNAQVPCDSVTLNDKKFAFTLKAAGATFRANSTTPKMKRSARLNNSEIRCH